VTADDFGEGVFGLMLGILCEQLQVGVAHVHKYIAAAPANPTKNRRDSTRSSSR